jgi:hypothetical protein
MCDFHSTAWRMLGQDIQVCHLPNNSHSEMIEAAGWKDNQPNRQTVVFEAEWSGEGKLPEAGAIIRNSGECPERLTRSIMSHYRKLKEALSEGKHLGRDGYFRDHKTWADVWRSAMHNGHMPDFTDVKEFSGYVNIEQGGSLTAPVLAKCGDVSIAQGGSLTAPVLAKCGYVSIAQGGSLTAPVLAKCGCVSIAQGGSLTAPKLKY